MTTGLFSNIGILIKFIFQISVSIILIVTMVKTFNTGRKFLDKSFYYFKKGFRKITRIKKMDLPALIKMIIAFFNIILGVIFLGIFSIFIFIIMILIFIFSHLISL